MVCLDLNKIERSLKIKEVQLPELGGSVFVRELSAKELLIVEEDMDKKGNGMHAMLLFSVCKEDGSRMFNTNDEVRAFLDKASGKVALELTRKCSEMNTMVEVTEEAKN